MIRILFTFIATLVFASLAQANQKSVTHITNAILRVDDARNKMVLAMEELDEAQAELQAALSSFYTAPKSFTCYISGGGSVASWSYEGQGRNRKQALGSALRKCISKGQIQKTSCEREYNNALVNRQHYCN